MFEDALDIRRSSGRWQQSDVVGRFIELVKTRIPRRFGFNPIRDIQVLCPMNRGGVGARSLNIELQAALNPAGDRKVERFGWTFAPGDKVMQIENDYDKEVYNGDIGFVTSVEPDEGELTASFDDRPVAYSFGELDTLVPAYSATIHKSQGSEYPAVVIPIMTQHYAMLQRNLLYTGVTRGKRLVVLVGQKKAVAIAVRNVSGRRRWSKLAEWLRGQLNSRSAKNSRVRKNRISSFRNGPESGYAYRAISVETVQDRNSRTGKSHHSINSSALACSVSGTVSPSALAVLRLMISSNLVGCCIGKSEGFSPLRIRPT